MKRIAVIGGGPAGLIAAERMAQAGADVTVYDRKPSLGRKFLLAGCGGLNLTNTVPEDAFAAKYGKAALWIAPFLKRFSPQDLRNWADGLDAATFVGTSGRVFPKEMKATGLLRNWLRRLDALGVKFVTKALWKGWDGKALLFETPSGLSRVETDFSLLALGGASWPNLGSDGSWKAILEKEDVAVSPLRPANCGFLVTWSAPFREKHAGDVLKPVLLRFQNHEVQGEATLSSKGIEGGAVYALSAALRDALEEKGEAVLFLDLRPGLDEDHLRARLAARGSLSLSNLLRKKGGLSTAAAALVREHFGAGEIGGGHADALAALVKNFPLPLRAPYGIERAISTAGGVSLEALAPDLSLKSRPDVFVAGEMLDWEAPTGGYLLQGCFSTGCAAADGILARA